MIKELFLTAIPVLMLMGCDPKAQADSANTSDAAKQESPTTAPVQKTTDDWKKQLPAATYKVMFECGTEPPFKNAYHDNKAAGIYVSAATGKPLFSSENKYDSKSGWPSFTMPIDEKAVIIRPDPDGSGRLEVIDASSGGHLGHVFDDGPAPTGKRYCMNSAAMKFIPAEKAGATTQPSQNAPDGK